MKVKKSPACIAPSLSTPFVYTPWNAAMRRMIDPLHLLYSSLPILPLTLLAPSRSTFNNGRKARRLRHSITIHCRKMEPIKRPKHPSPLPNFSFSNLRNYFFQSPLNGRRICQRPVTNYILGQLQQRHLQEYLEVINRLQWRDASQEREINNQQSLSEVCFAKTHCCSHSTCSLLQMRSYKRFARIGQACVTKRRPYVSSRTWFLRAPHLAEQCHVASIPVQWQQRVVTGNYERQQPRCLLDWWPWGEIVHFRRLRSNNIWQNRHVAENHRLRRSSRPCCSSEPLGNI